MASWRMGRVMLGAKTSRRLAGFGRRNRRKAFWHLCRARLVVAVLENTGEELRLHDCATLAVPTEPGPLAELPFPPGLLECARVVGASGLRQVAALGAEHASLVTLASGGPEGLGEPAADMLGVAVGGLEAQAVVAERATVVAVVETFREAGLWLEGLDCEAVARISLASYLDQPMGSAHGPCDPLAAVELLADAEARATALGELLTAPVGLAIGHFGLARYALS